MTYLVIALFGYGILSIVSILDKFILTKSVRSASLYTYYSTIFFLLLLALIPFVGMPHNPTDAFWSILSGLSFGSAFFAMFLSLKRGEETHLSPFIGATTTIATYLFSLLILGESLTIQENFGVLLLIVAGIMLSFEKMKNMASAKMSIVYALFAGALFGLSHVSAKYIYDLYPFLTGIVFTKAPTGFIGLALLFSPAVRKRNQQEKESSSLGIVVVDKILGIIGVLLIQLAIANGRVTIVNALSGVQYVLVFIFAYLLTKIVPRIFNEYFTKKEILVEIGALAIVCIGLFLVSFSQ